MFDKSYQFRVVNHKETSKQGHKVIVYTCSFKTDKNNTYIVEMEMYEFHFFAIKFYYKYHKLSKNKFKLNTGAYEVGPILATCIKIMLSFYESNHFASFGFLAEFGREEKNGEYVFKNSKNENFIRNINRDNSKRFSIYRYLFRQKFSPLNFYHYEKKEKNIYLLINRCDGNEDRISKIENMLKDIYPEEVK
jgi:hypothetical protein